MGEQEINWVKIVERKHPPLFVYFIIGGLKKELIKDATDIEHEFKNFQKIGLDLYFDIDEIKSLTSKIAEETKEKGVRYPKEHAERCYSQCEAFLKTSQNIGKIRDLRSLTNHKLVTLFSDYTEQAEKMASYLTTVIACQNALRPIFDERLRKLAERSGEIELINEYKANLSVPSRENLFVENMKELISIGSEIQTSEEVLQLFNLPEEEIVEKLPKIAPSVWNKIKLYIDKFGWMKPQYYKGEVYTVNDVIQRLRNILSEDCSKKKSEMADEKRERARKFTETLNKLDAKPDFFDLVETIRDYLHLRTCRLEVFFIANEYVRNLLREIANRLGVTYDDIIFLTHGEIIELLKRNESADTSLIQERKGGFAMIMVERRLNIYSGDPYKRLLEKEVKEKPTKIEGIVASRGKTKGLAKIVLVNEDIYKVNKGDIIIATMTTPNFIPAIEKCSAIVTNEGGMLCHAAIVSREFGIPCIIGTKKATKILNDGDLIGVDATGKTGIVNIL